MRYRTHALSGSSHPQQPEECTLWVIQPCRRSAQVEGVRFHEATVLTEEYIPAVQREAHYVLRLFVQPGLLWAPRAPAICTSGSTVGLSSAFIFRPDGSVALEG